MDTTGMAMEPREVADPRAQRRRNLRTALWLGLLAFGFYGLFFWSMSHRGG